MDTKHRIQNYEQLASDSYRKDALDIAEAGLEAIRSEVIINNAIRIDEDYLHINDEVFKLTDYQSIKVIGFGKASSKAAKALEETLGERINSGVVIDKEADSCKIIKVYRGTHPRPSLENFGIAQDIIALADNPDEKDLFIVIVSGGGSALLCWPESECLRGQELYDAFLQSGETIRELNTVRKHISLVKGGGLAKLLYPATVIGLIFSDIPGEHYDQVASGPTFKDTSTVEDAEKIIANLDISALKTLGKLELFETPKEDKFFEKVHNFVLVSNHTALNAMAMKAKLLGYAPNILSAENYKSADDSISQFIDVGNSPKSVLLVGGEIRLKIDKSGGSGGRNSYLASKAIGKLDDSVLISIASDGIDNGDSAGAIVDDSTNNIANGMKINVSDHVERYDTYDLFEKLKGTIYTGPTGSNVSDLIIYLKK
jgi:glycerate-2-kinase